MAQRSGVALFGSAIPVSVSWAGDDAGGSGIVRYELQKGLDLASDRDDDRDDDDDDDDDDDNGGWVIVSSTLTAPTTNLTVSTKGTIQFRVRAIDAAGNTGAWVLGSVLSPRLVQDGSRSVSYAGRWSKAKANAYSDGSVRYARSKGASATIRTTGTSFALVTTRGRERGVAWIYVNGSLKAKVDLYSATTRYRQVVWQTSWAGTAPTIKVVVAGTSGRPRVDLDAFAILK
ncbi:MAG TPA: hypothetical protein VES19_08535 [Candidatus Limnocylindrales bacterium]|nr:hypothetical protein [Candidatus Limnocylindrales bacterium]